MIFVIDIREQSVTEYDTENFCVWLTYRQTEGLDKKRYLFCSSKKHVLDVFDRVGIDTSFLGDDFYQEERTIN